MFKAKKIILLFVGIILVSFIAFIGLGVRDFLNFRNVAKSASGLPWQDGGTIMLVRQPCVLDTPVIAPVTCELSCPLVTSVWGTACTGYIEIITQAQQGTIFIAAPIGFKYSGGGTFPKAGDQFIAGGASNALPWVIGIPGAAALRMQKLADTFEFIIAGFRK